MISLSHQINADVNDLQRVFEAVQSRLSEYRSKMAVYEQVLVENEQQLELHNQLEAVRTEIADYNQKRELFERSVSHLSKTMNHSSAA